MFAYINLINRIFFLVQASNKILAYLTYLGDLEYKLGYHFHQKDLCILELLTFCNSLNFNLK